MVALRAEGQPPDPGVNSVGADHEAEGLRGAAFELDAHAIGGLGQRGDRVAEAVLAVGGGALVQDRGEIPAQDLGVAAGEFARHDRHFAPGGV